MMMDARKINAVTRLVGVGCAGLAGFAAAVGGPASGKHAGGAAGEAAGKAATEAAISTTQPEFVAGSLNADKLSAGSAVNVGMLQTMNARRVDINGDGAVDLLMESFDGPMRVLDGRSGEVGELKLDVGADGVAIGAVRDIAGVAAVVDGERRTGTVMLGSEGGDFDADEGVWTLSLFWNDGDGGPGGRTLAWQARLNEASGDPAKRNDVDAAMAAGDLDGDGADEIVLVYGVSAMTSTGDGGWVGPMKESRLAVYTPGGERLAQVDVDAGMQPTLLVAPKTGSLPGQITVVGFETVTRLAWKG